MTPDREVLVKLIAMFDQWISRRVPPASFESAYYNELTVAVDKAREQLQTSPDDQVWTNQLDAHNKALIQALESQITVDDARMVLDAFLDQRLIEGCQLLHDAMAAQTTEVSLGQPFVLTLRVRGVVIDRKKYKDLMHYVIQLGRRPGRQIAEDVRLVVASDEVLSAIVVAVEGES